MLRKFLQSVDSRLGIAKRYVKIICCCHFSLVSGQKLIDDRVMPIMHFLNRFTIAIFKYQNQVPRYPCPWNRWYSVGQGNRRKCTCMHNADIAEVLAFHILLAMKAAKWTLCRYWRICIGKSEGTRAYKGTVGFDLPIWARMFQIWSH